MAVELEGLEFEIVDNSENASKGIDSLTDSLTRLKEAVRGGASLNSYIQQVKKLDEALSNVKNLDKLQMFAQVMQSLNGVGNIQISPSIAQELSRISSVANTLSVDSIQNITQFGQAIQNMGGLNTVQIPGTIATQINQVINATSRITPGMIQNVRSYAQALQQLANVGNINIPNIGTGGAGTGAGTGTGSGNNGNAPVIPQTSGTTQIAPAVQQATAATQGLGAAARQATSQVDALAGTSERFRGLHLVLENIGSVTRRIFSSLIGLPMQLGARLATSVRQVTSSFSRFFSGLKRIAFYRLIRSIISRFTQGFSEGMKNLYNYSQIIGTQFASSMDRLATSSLYLKNSLGAMAAPIINALAPAIDFVVDKIVTLLNLINQLFAKLGGSSTYTAAKKMSTTWGDAADKASGSAKKAAEDAKRYLLGFDELNILGKPDTGSGSGSGAGATAADYASMFEEVEIDSSVSDFVERIKECFASQDWKGLGDEIGGKINEAIEAVPWGAIGSKVGSFLDGSIKSSYFTLKAINFENLGKGFADALNNFFGSVEWEYLGRLLTRRLTSLGDLIIGFFMEFDFGTLGASISSFASGVFREITEWLNDKKWDEIGGSIWTKLTDFINGLNIGQLVYDAFKAAGTLIRSAADLLVGFFGEMFDDVKSWWDENVSADTFGETVHNLWLEGLEWVADIGTWVTDNIIGPFGEALLGEDWEDVVEAGAKLWDAFAEGIGDVVMWLEDNVIDPIAEAFASIGKMFDKTNERVETTLEVFQPTTVHTNENGEVERDIGFWDLFWQAGQKAFEEDFLDPLYHFFHNDTIESMIPTEALQGAVDLIQEFADTYDFILHGGSSGSFDSNILDEMTNKIKGARDEMEQFLQDLGLVLHGGSSGSFDNNSSILDEIRNKTKGARDEMEKFIQDLGLVTPGNLLTGVGGLVDKVKQKIEETKKVITEQFQPALDNFKTKFFNDQLDLTEKQIDEIRKIIEKVLEKLGLLQNGMSGLDGKTSVDVDVNVKPGVVSGTNKPATVGNLFDNAVSIVVDISRGKITETGKPATLEGLFGTAISVVANMTRGVVNETGKTATFDNLFGTAVKAVVDIASGKVTGNGKPATLDNLFGTAISVTANMVRGTISGNGQPAYYSNLFGSSIVVTANMKRGVVQGTSTSASFAGLFGTAVNAAVNISKGKIVNTSTTASLTGLFGTTVTASANLQKGKIANTSTTASLTGLFGNSITVAVNLVKGQASDAVKKFVEAWGFAGGGAIDAAGRIMQFAEGGSFSPGGIEYWNGIPKYAGGGVHGSMFLAGESGPEMVGHVNGRSEVLNKSQLAQTMHSSIVSAMAQFTPYFTGIKSTIKAAATMVATANYVTAEEVAKTVPANTVYERDTMDRWIANTANSGSGMYGELTADQIAEGVRDGIYDSTARQNELLREQNDLLRIIAGKDTTVEITANAIARAMNRKSMREGTL